MPRFDSAVTTVVDGLDRLNTTAESHKRVMVLEVMGRHAGWIALWGGIAGGANVILIPEIPFELKKVAAFIRQRDARQPHEGRAAREALNSPHIYHLKRKHGVFA